MPLCVCAYTCVYDKKIKSASEKTKKIVRVLTKEGQSGRLIQIKITQFKMSKPENA